MSEKRRDRGMPIWKRIVFVFVAALASILAILGTAALLTRPTESFVIPLGPFGAASVRRYGFGIDLEDRDGGWHGVALSYYPGQNESASWHVIRTHVTPQQRARGSIYFGSPECPYWGFMNQCQ